MRRPPQTILLALAAAAALAVAGCGGGSNDGGNAGAATAKTGAPLAKTGGKLTMLWTDDVDSIDPGITWYQPAIGITYATQKPLFNYKPDEPQKPVADLAAGPADVSADGKTVTVKIKDGVKYSPPYDKLVTSKDVKYGIERAFFDTVNNGYANAYFGDIVGAKEGVKAGTTISGIDTPDDQTLVFHLKRGTGAVLAAAMVMPITAPVPEAYAAKYDAKSPSTYGEHELATGPYMVENDAEGNLVGYKPGKSIHIVRNPSWDRALGFQPAYLNEIDMPQGNNDVTVASHQILDGKGMVSGDWSPPPSIIREASQHYPDQITFVPARGGRYISLNTGQAPFDDVNVRKAVLAGFNREALLLARGGRAIGTVPTHWLSPGLDGFQLAGGLKGPGDDFMSHPEGDMQLAAEYFKKAGYASGKYEGDKEIFMVGTSDNVPGRVAEVAKENFERLGFKVRMRLVTQDAMYTKYCFTPSADIDACPSLGWYPDFTDPQAMLDPIFNGKNILPQNNSNLSELDDPKINAAMDSAELITDPAARAKAWAEIDRMVTAVAPAIPYQWERAPLIRSADVNGVVNQFNDVWDIAFTSLR